MSDTGTVVVFGVVVVGALTMMSYLLWNGAGSLGHAPGRVAVRLGLLWFCVAAAVLVGLLLRRVFRGALFEISFTRHYDTPWFQLSGPGAGLFLAVGLVAMAVCALVALWAISSLQHPADPAAPEEEATTP